MHNNTKRKHIPDVFKNRTITVRSSLWLKLNRMSLPWDRSLISTHKIYLFKKKNSYINCLCSCLVAFPGLWGSTYLHSFEKSVLEGMRDTGICTLALFQRCWYLPLQSSRTCWSFRQRTYSPFSSVTVSWTDFPFDFATSLWPAWRLYDRKESFFPLLTARRTKVQF